MQFRLEDWLACDASLAPYAKQEDADVLRSLGWGRTQNAVVILGLAAWGHSSIVLHILPTTPGTLCSQHIPSRAMSEVPLTLCSHIFRKHSKVFVSIICLYWAEYWTKQNLCMGKWRQAKRYIQAHKTTNAGNKNCFQSEPPDSSRQNQQDKRYHWKQILVYDGTSFLKLSHSESKAFQCSGIKYKSLPNHT